MSYNGSLLTTCPNCGNNLHGHGNKTVKIIDVPMYDKPTTLILKIPRRRCPNCSYIWVPAINEIDNKRLMTKTALTSISEASLRRSFIDVADSYGVSHVTAKNTFIDFFNENQYLMRFQTPIALGISIIDIKNLGKITVFTDLVHMTIFDIINGDDSDTIMNYIRFINNQNSVKWICYDNAILKKEIDFECGNTIINVVDFYSIVTLVNSALGSVISSVSKELTKKYTSLKKGIGYLLRKRKKDCSKIELQIIDTIRKDTSILSIGKAYDLKEEFFNIYDDSSLSVSEASDRINDWAKRIPKAPEFKDFHLIAQIMKKHTVEIMNIHNCPTKITKAYQECNHRMSKEHNVRGRGNSFEILRNRTLYRKSDITALIESNQAGNNNLIGPPVPKSGPTFHFEETGGYIEDNSDNTMITSDPFDYNPYIGLRPKKDYSVSTGFIYYTPKE